MLENLNINWNSVLWLGLIAVALAWLLARRKKLKAFFDLKEVGGIFIIGMIVAQMGFLGFVGITAPFPKIKSPIPPPPPSEYDGFYGIFTIKISQYGYYDFASDSPTNPVYTYFTKKPAIGVVGEPLTVAGEDVVLPKENEGKFWLVAYCGDDFFPVVENVNVDMGEIVDSYWEDYDVDGDDDLIFLIDASGIPKGEPKQQLTVGFPLIDEDSTLTLSSPSDQTSLGTSQTTFTITWELTTCSAKSGFVIGRLYFTTNSTREGTDVTFETLSISAYGGTQDLYWDTYVHKAGEGSAYEVWYIRNSDYKEWHLGELFHRPTQKVDMVYITLTGKWTGNTAGVLVTIYIDQVDPAQNVVQDTDGVVLNDS